MAVQEDAKEANKEKGAADEPLARSDDGALASSSAELVSEANAAETNADAEKYDVALVGGAVAPTQLGTRRFVYAAYFAGAITIAFLLSKLVDVGWVKLQTYVPAIGEPRDEIVMALSGVIGALVAVYFWRRTRARQLAEEVATEMSLVTWPSRTEVTNGTVVVIVTTLVSTVFFALMDKFWGFVTNLVYGGT
jgi:preprotein translocase SecE subunit